jgi:hypothetical protein
MSRTGKVIGVGLLLCAATLTGFLCWAIVGIHADFASAAASVGAIPPTIQSATKSVTDASSAVQTAVQTVVPEVTRPCRGKGDATDNCGFLAETKKVEAKLGDAVVTTQLQVQNSQTLMLAAAKAIAGAGEDIHTATGHLDTAIDTANSAVAALQPPLQKLPSIEDAAQLAITHIDALSQSPNIQKTIANGALITTSFASMADTGARVAKKEGDSILHPSPWKAFYPWAMIGAKTAACIWAGAC